MNFGTTHIGDRVELADQTGPKSEPWMDLLLRILEHVVRLLEAQTAIEQAMAELEAAGMFPAVPTEIWEDRTNATHGQKRYLRLGFPKGTLLNGQRKLYVGCKEKKITKARQMAGRRRRWELLEKERVRLERFLRMTRGSLEREAGSVRRYKIPDDLGLDGDVADVSAGPKGSSCEGCVFKELDADAGWCYMFDERPPGRCAQYQTSVVAAASEFVRPAGSGAEWNVDVEGRVLDEGS